MTEGSNRLLPSQEAQFVKAPPSPLTTLVLDIVDQHLRFDHLGNCQCGVRVRPGKQQRHIDTVVHPAVKAYLLATEGAA